MKRSVLSKHLSELGKKGGKARQDMMTPEEQQALVRKASKAAAEARKRKARERKAKQKKQS
jgi:hypothetical protein